MNQEHGAVKRHRAIFIGAQPKLVRACNALRNTTYGKRKTKTLTKRDGSSICTTVVVAATKELPSNDDDCSVCQQSRRSKVGHLHEYAPRSSLSSPDAHVGPPVGRSAAPSDASLDLATDSKGSSPQPKGSDDDAGARAELKLICGYKNK